MTNKAWLRIASAVAAAMLSYVVLQIVTNDMPFSSKIAIVAAVGLVALAIAFWSGRHLPEEGKGDSTTTIASDITAKGNVGVKGVEINRSRDGDAEVATKISSGKDVRIEDVRVGTKGDKGG